MKVYSWEYHRTNWGIFQFLPSQAMSLDSRKIPHQEPIEELVTRSTEDGHSGCLTSYDPN